MCLWDVTAELSDMPMRGSTSGVGDDDYSNSTRLQQAQRTRPETAVTVCNTRAEAFEAHVRPAQNQELDNTIKLNEKIGRRSNECNWNRLFFTRQSGLVRRNFRFVC